MSAEVLRLAAAIVRERGLAKGVYEDVDHRVCVFGALACARFGRVGSALAEGPDVEADATLVRAIVGEGSIVDWNDDPERTAEDVARALEAAAVFHFGAAV